jgi:hypothetical protein
MYCDSTLTRSWQTPDVVSADNKAYARNWHKSVSKELQPHLHTALQEAVESAVVKLGNTLSTNTFFTLNNTTSFLELRVDCNRQSKEWPVFFLRVEEQCAHAVGEVMVHGEAYNALKKLLFSGNSRLQRIKDIGATFDDNERVWFESTPPTEPAPEIVEAAQEESTCDEVKVTETSNANNTNGDDFW